MPITAIYAALLALLLIVLSFRVIFVRMSEKVSLGDGGKKVLEQRIRAQANFVEYAPMALILVGLLESLHAPAWSLHALGATLVVGRALHGYGLTQTPQWVPGRFIGMNATFAVIVIAAGMCLWYGVMAVR